VACILQIINNFPRVFNMYIRNGTHEVHHLTFHFHLPLTNSDLSVKVFASDDHQAPPRNRHDVNVLFLPPGIENCIYCWSIQLGSSQRHQRRLSWSTFDFRLSFLSLIMVKTYKNVVKTKITRREIELWFKIFLKLFLQGKLSSDLRKTFKRVLKNPNQAIYLNWF